MELLVVCRVCINRRLWVMPTYAVLHHASSYQLQLTLTRFTQQLSAVLALAPNTAQHSTPSPSHLNSPIGEQPIPYPSILTVLVRHVIDPSVATFVSAYGPARVTESF